MKQNWINNVIKDQIANKQN